MKRRRPLDFARLRKVNVHRCTRSFKHPLSDWSLLEWAGAMCGEAGEATNVAKKIRRLTTKGKAKNWHRTEKRELLKRFGDELADVVIYACLNAAAARIDLGEAIIRKFNKDSEKRGSRIRL